MNKGSSIKTLHQYIEVDEGMYLVYEAYQPDVETLRKVRDLLPQASVVVATHATCADCLRNVPRMARIAEFLPVWTWKILDKADNPLRLVDLNIQRVPTFIIYNAEGEETGRIEENPSFGSLELDLLYIARQSV